MQQPEYFKIGHYDVMCMLTNALDVLTFEYVDKIFAELHVIQWLREYDDLQQEFLQVCHEELTPKEFETIVLFLKNPL